MPLLNDVMKEALRLFEGCPMIATATCADEIYKTFSRPPYLPPEDADDGMWMTANQKLEDLFGRDGQKNILKGPEGIALVIDWINKARKHPSWDSPVDKERRLHKKGNFDSGSDLLIKVKFERICTSVEELQESLPTGSQPAQPIPNRSNGIKRWIVSNSTLDLNVSVAEEPKPPPKRQQKVAGGSTTILISSEDEIVFVKSNVKGSKTGKNSKKKNMIDLCPLSKPDQPCIRCKVEPHEKGKIFTCHCGASPVTLRRGRIEAAQVHWKSAMCKNATAALRTNTLLSTYFVKDPALQPVNKNIIDTVCLGLTDETWVRPRATQTIAQFMESTCTIYCGIDRHKLCKELFGPDIRENDLIPSQKAQFLATMDARGTWVVKRNGDRNAIYSTSCEKTFKRHKKDPTQTCKPCLDLKEVDSVVSAINHKYADNDNFKFTPTTLLGIDTYHTLRRKHLEKLSLMAKKGLFQNREAMKGMIMGCSIRAEREEAGKSL
ncbi:uncharacterized protein MELLADRAFT_95096 [Melampsora larici-populina 98AG31]|uniref:Uncharacterized protein n=1 Tax=Melampsora larici-populina (strain 98AG31 / pathotype 3-4-7) TaxID=747676 RepID=F4RCM8_MELLP|nr:uncharacterized protein MELLADRAFT_95096 [Melampsora larici-populina 98AG31]EGG09658.1 hypothetical protein MELLADRAFT_95096 [Melampsora larici-populina 98AG31]